MLRIGGHWNCCLAAEISCFLSIFVPSSYREFRTSNLPVVKCLKR
uniref:Uncharacterized protein n=1 Tax=Nelumbo nucifera TaxID=4432 RepID=A0A822YVE9_NELNU|nr:TPA_asm: hypothetical protein HUJ06_005356 [Nelumbo nucifera]